MMIVMRAVVVLVVLACVTSAHAEEPTRTESYRSTVAVVDAISLGTLGAGIALTTTQEGGLRAAGIITIVVGAGGFIWGSPIVHYRRGRDELYKIDIGLRVIVPGLAAGIAAGTTTCPDDIRGACSRQVTATLVAGGLGALAVSMLDIALFARQRVPVVTPTAGGATLGIAGRF